VGRNAAGENLGFSERAPNKLVTLVLGPGEKRQRKRAGPMSWEEGGEKDIAGSKRGQSTSWVDHFR